MSCTFLRRTWACVALCFHTLLQTFSLLPGQLVFIHSYPRILFLSMQLCYGFRILHRTVISLFLRNILSVSQSESVHWEPVLFKALGQKQRVISALEAELLWATTRSVDSVVIYSQRPFGTLHALAVPVCSVLWTSSLYGAYRSRGIFRSAIDTVSLDVLLRISAANSRKRLGLGSLFFLKAPQGNISSCFMNH